MDQRAQLFFAQEKLYLILVGHGFVRRWKESSELVVADGDFIGGWGEGFGGFVGRLGLGKGFGLGLLVDREFYHLVLELHEVISKNRHGLALVGRGSV